MQKTFYYFGFVISLTLFNFFNAQAQCNVLKDNTSTETTIFFNSKERIYVNEDFENGFKSAWVKGAFFVDKKDKNKAKYYLIVTYAKSGRQAEIIPRQINFNFINGQTLMFKAEQHEVVNLNGTPGDEYYFKITLAEMQQIKISPIQSFIITDSRTMEKLVTSPYKALFQEQIECLLKELNEL